MNTQIIHQDSIDQMEWQECLSSAPKIQQLCQSSELATVADLAADVFASFYQPTPEMNENIAATHFINKKLINKLNESAPYHNLREQTVNDALSATIATSFITEKIASNIPPELKEQAKQIQALESNEEDPATQKAIETISDKIRAAMKEASEEIEGFTAAAAGFSLCGEGNPQNGTYENRLNLYKTLKNNKKLQRVMLFAGRAMRIALQTQREKTIYPPTETVSITLGNDLTKTLPSEFGLLADEDTEILFFLKLVQGQLLNYEQIGHENVGQGPIVYALDESGSMTNPVIGESIAGAGIEQLTREEWSKGIMLALHSIAKKQKRDFCVLHYASTGQLKTEIFKEGAAEPQAVIETINHFYNGGTDFSPWMKKAQELISESEWEKADVIVNSDGLTHIPQKDIDQWNKLKAERKFRSYGILIGTTEGEALLQSICNETFTLIDMFNEKETLTTIFGI